MTGWPVFGDPYEKDGVTVIPAVKMWGGGGGGGDGAEKEAGGGGFGVDARPAGVFVIKGEGVTWIPAVDVNRIIVGSQLIAIIGILSWRSVMRARARR